VLFLVTQLQTPTGFAVAAHVPPVPHAVPTAAVEAVQAALPPALPSEHNRLVTTKSFTQRQVVEHPPGPVVPPLVSHSSYAWRMPSPQTVDEPAVWLAEADEPELDPATPAAPPGRPEGIPMHVPVPVPHDAPRVPPAAMLQVAFPAALRSEQTRFAHPFTLGDVELQIVCSLKSSQN
jgi:hypothetical protein